MEKQQVREVTIFSLHIYQMSIKSTPNIMKN